MPELFLRGHVHHVEALLPEPPFRFVFDFCVLILDIPDVGGPIPGPLAATIACI